jgi:signal transduction histidine kinase
MPFSFLRKPHGPVFIWPLGLLACGLALSALAAFQMHRQLRQEYGLRFDRQTDHVRAGIEETVGRYQNALQGLDGLHMASQSVERGEWRAYVKSLPLGEYPGFIGFGFTRRVPTTDLPAFLAATRADGAPDFALHAPPGLPMPDGSEAWVDVVEFTEPMETNRAAQGVIMVPDSPRGRVLEAAMRSGEQRMTGPLTLAQLPPPGLGVLMFDPVYAKDMPSGTPAGRAAAIRGWAYAAINLDAMLAQVSKRLDQQADFEVFDGDSGKLDNLLFDADGHLVRAKEAAVTDRLFATRLFHRQLSMDMLGRTWNLHVSSTPAFEAQATYLPVWLLLAGGTGLSLLLAYVVLLLARTRDRALALAQTMTADLRKSQDELTKARDAAQAGSRAKSEFLASMSHEIRTPMNGILGMAEIIGQGELSAEQRENLGILHASAKSLLDLLNGILDLSKIESGKMEVEHLPVELRPFLAEILREPEARAKTKKLAFSLAVADDLPPAVCTDPVRLRQILSNLVGNAIKFTERGQVKVALARAAGEGGKAELELRVEDTGIGIDAQACARLFTPFTQADSSTTRRFGGTGLGLVVCQRLTALLGGRISLSSEPGKGSVVTVRLPLTAAVVVPPRHGPASPAPAPRPLRVLLAEDSPVNQTVARLLLEKRGHQVEVVGDGREALARMRVGNLDVVLMDVQMPVLDGLNATRRFRAGELRGQHLRIVALTANAMRGDQQACLDAGMDAYVVKPVLPAALYAAVEGHGLR